MILLVVKWADVPGVTEVSIGVRAFMADIRAIVGSADLVYHSDCLACLQNNRTADRDKHHHYQVVG
jgi:hypothetical protein